MGHAAVCIAREDFETTEKEMTMETNPIIDDLRAKASLDWPTEQKAFYTKQAADARPVHCVRMRDVFTPEQLAFIRGKYKTQQKMCYRNATELVRLITHPWAFLFPEPVRYVEGFAYSCGILPIEHAFVKYGDQYIDPTFERALHLDVRNEYYVSCIELDPLTMAEYQLETGYYGELYQYAWLKQYRPELAEKIRSLNPHNRR